MAASTAACAWPRRQASATSASSPHHRYRRHRDGFIKALLLLSSRWPVRRHLLLLAYLQVDRHLHLHRGRRSSTIIDHRSGLLGSRSPSPATWRLRDDAYLRTTAAHDLGEQDAGNTWWSTGIPTVRTRRRIRRPASLRLGFADPARAFRPGWQPSRRAPLRAWHSGLSVIAFHERRLAGKVGLDEMYRPVTRHLRCACLAASAAARGRLLTDEQPSGTARGVLRQHPHTAELGLR